MKKTLMMLFVAAPWVCGPALAQDWPQWGRDSQHTSSIDAAGQATRRIRADVLYDPNTEEVMEDQFNDGGLSVHYQVPLIDGNDVFMEFKGPTFTDFAHWETQSWSERRLHWENGQLVQKWSFDTDWKPVPFSFEASGPKFEPVFHALLANGHVYVPGAGGTLLKVNRGSGSLIKRINPFGSVIHRNIFVAGVPTADSAGNIYYTAIQFAPGHAWDSDVVNSWLVKVSSKDKVRKATFASLTPGAPAGQDQCITTFSPDTLPWPPTPDAATLTSICGSQRPGINAAPAVAPNGTIYVVSTAHMNSRASYLVAANPDLTPKWHSSLADRFNDGCNVLLPPNGSPGGCREGATTGVDPGINRPGGGRVLDSSTSSPIVAPDGSIFYGAYSRYPWVQGRMMKFSPSGVFLASFPAGFDLTPGIYRHDGTYSIVTKENHYTGFGSYCGDPTFCPPDRTASQPSDPEAYFVTQLSSDLEVEWRFQNTNTDTCSRDDDGGVTCVPDPEHTAGFEWCINGLAIDRDGNVFGNSEDGYLYAIQQGGTLKDKLFLSLGIEAAYTPLSMDRRGRIYTQNFGHLIVVGQ